MILFSIYGLMHMDTWVRGKYKFEKGNIVQFINNKRARNHNPLQLNGSNNMHDAIFCKNKKLINQLIALDPMI
jgi:hypothetical protein